MDYKTNLKFTIYTSPRLSTSGNLNLILNIKNLDFSSNFKFQISNLFWRAYVLQN